MNIVIGQMTPNFNLADKDKIDISLNDYKGKWVIIYFYPKDDTPGCTIEALDFTRFHQQFKQLNTEIIGISPDTCESHDKFYLKHKLGITLLSDPEHKIIENYDAWHLKKLYGKEHYGVVRSTFIIDPQGKIAYIWTNVKADGHAEIVLDKLKSLQSG